MNRLLATRSAAHAIAAGLAIIGAIINFATRRPAMRLVAVALAMLCVSGIWKLVLSMEA